MLAPATALVLANARSQERSSPVERRRPRLPAILAAIPALATSLMAMTWFLMC